MKQWHNPATYSWREQERIRARERRFEVAAIVACYLTAVGGATGLFIWLSTHSPY